MPFDAHCYRLGRVVPLLNEKEWASIDATSFLVAVQTYRAETGASVEVARAHLADDPAACRCVAQYEEMTGLRLDHPDQIWAVRMSKYGALCPECARPFRTPKAKLCAECGYTLPRGQVAGPLRA